MRLLFEIDKKDYKKDGTEFVRPSVRGIIIKDGKLAMIHSLKYDYYKFPGGGMEKGEQYIETLIREVKEESGLSVIPESIREYGYVHRIQKGEKEDKFIQNNYYYLCEAEETIERQELDDYEADEKFTLEFVTPHYAIEVNKLREHGEKDLPNMYEAMIERENRVMELLIEEEQLKLWN